MNTTFLSGIDIRKEMERLAGRSDEIHIAVAWGTTHPLVDLLLENRTRLRRFLVGTHFYQTEPALLERLRDLPAAGRVMEAGGQGVFHPKVYVFFTGDKASAIIGSANLTSGAMSRNTEACLLLEGSRRDPVIAELLAFIDTQWEKGHPG
jgi:HKD family nuclease